MFSATTPRRNFTASNVKQICMLANSRQADLIGSKIMANLRKVSADSVTFTGYGGDWMKKEGFQPTIELDLDMMTDKQFHTYRKTKTAHENLYFKWNPLNLVNKAYVRKTDDAFENVSDDRVTYQVCLCTDDAQRSAPQDSPVSP